MSVAMRQQRLVLTLFAVMVGCSSSDRNGGADGDASMTGDGDAMGDVGMTGDGDPTGDMSGDPPGDGDTVPVTGDDDAGMALLPGSIGDWTIPDELLLCNGGPCQCANGIDDDGDGVADGFDSECTGPNDDDEGSFATGIPGDNKDNAHQDCFFDGDSGQGNDGCRYDSGCLTGELAQTDPACQVSQACIDFCQPRTPNGCDCFGCCSFLTASGTTVEVFIGSGGDCSEENLDACQTCVPNTNACSNSCGECELCPGKTLEDLPATCYMTPGDTTTGDGDTTTGDGDTTTGDGDTTTPVDPPFVCDGGAKACWDSSGCDPGFYCALGCCLLIPPT